MDHLLNDAEEAAVVLRSIIQNLPKVFDYNSQEINICEKETQDLLHIIELTSFHAAKGYHFSKELQKARLRRRELKNQNELIEPLLAIVKRMKTFEHELNKVIGDIRRIKSNQENRQYKMRVREDLQKEVSIGG